MKDRLPKGILTRSKMGFGVPISRWFRTELREYVKEVLLDSKALARPYFNEVFIRKMIKDHEERRAEHGQKLWALLMFELWHRNFIDRVPESPRL